MNTLRDFETLPAGAEPMNTCHEHEGVFNGKSVRYQARLETYEIVGNGDGDESARAFIVATSYCAIAMGGAVVDAARRPVTFVFNGGPIVPSAFLQMLAFAPQRLDVDADPQYGEDEAPLVGNRDAVLDVTDIVLFDPPGTGFSTVADDTDERAFHSVNADAHAFSTFVRAWCARHGRLDAPIFVFGSSYGTIRAAAAAPKIAVGDEALRLDGIYLLGQAVNIVETVNRPENLMSYVVTLPTLAALGAYHRRSVEMDTPMELLMEKATRFAETSYLNALLKGQSISKDELQSVAQGLCELTGLSAQAFIDRRLKIGKVLFRELLLADQGLVIGGLDGRYVSVGDVHRPTRDISHVLDAPIQRAHREHLKGIVGVDPMERYNYQSPVKSLDDWRWGAATPFSDWRYGQSIADAMAANPALRLTIGVGYHDTFTTYGASRYAIKQSDWPLERVSFRAYYGGHMPYALQESLRSIMSDFRALVAGGRELATAPNQPENIHG
ncbi:hypothetical protein [Burkholderia pyrrocinia]|uniref:hypothetical protein n=1 Tax=Burkholderia pyrrocinia TaxID=60550 RepID=UPI002AB26224|nr:hypothetical protein [Burkholderia pyrrocinia]